MISIIDYGLGNVDAFLTVYKRLGYEACRVKSKDDLNYASKIILPGVGAFDHAIKLLNDSGMRKKLEELVMDKKVPILGVCVGMQILASSSEEGSLPGLGWIPGRVKILSSSDNNNGLVMPHMGWNTIHPNKDHPLFLELQNKARFYFLHSYYFECVNEINKNANTFYGLDFACVISSNNIYGVQFHPEKSHHFGTQLLKNFAEL